MNAVTVTVTIICSIFSRRVEEEIFPRMELGMWRNGINILSKKSGIWQPTTVANLLKPKASYADSFPIKNMSLGSLRGRELQRGAFESVAFYHIPYAKNTSRFQNPRYHDYCYNSDIIVTVYLYRSASQPLCGRSRV